MKTEKDEKNNWLRRESLTALALLTLTAVGIYLCFRIAQPFLPALVWALALAVVAFPLYEFFERRIKNPSLAAGVSVLLVAVIIAAPLVFVARQINREAARSAEIARRELTDGNWRARLEAYPRVAAALEWVEREADFQGAAEQFANFFAAQVANLLNSSVWFVVELLVIFFALFYFFRDRRQLLSGVRRFLPLAENETAAVFKSACDTIYATVYGTFVVALVQGALGGLMFWWLGLPAPILWGAAMAVLALVPFLGSFIVWLPAALFLGLSGRWSEGLILFAWGFVVVALVDNFLYPVLVGDRLRMHSLPVFFAFVGGFLLFGAVGIILGPLALAVTFELLDIWRRRFDRQAAAEA